MRARTKRRGQPARGRLTRKVRGLRTMRPMLERLEERCLLDAHGLCQSCPGLDDDQLAIPFIVELQDGPNDLVLRRHGDYLQLLDTLSGIEVASASAVSTSDVIVWGVDNVNDTLMLDFSGGEWTLPVTFHGGGGGV